MTGPLQIYYNIENLHYKVCFETTMMWKEYVLKMAKYPRCIWIKIIQNIYNEIFCTYSNNILILISFHPDKKNMVRSSIAKC